MTPGPPDPDALVHKQDTSLRSSKMPLVISDRLDDLVRLLNDEGTLVSTVFRHDLLCALIAAAPESAADLEKLMADYGNMKVREAVVGAAKGAAVIELRPLKPGRRTS